MISLSFKPSKGDRTLKAKNNIIASGFFKGADTLVYLLLVPLTLGYLDPYEYGIWLTLNSILAWIDTFDIGLGNGLRNKLSEAIAKDDKELARRYVSTTFFMLIALMIIIVAIGSTVIYLIDWNKVLNITVEVSHLTQIIQVSFFFFSLNFVLKFVGNVFQAMQLPVAMYIINFIGHTLSLVVIYILTKTTEGSLFLVAIAYSCAPPLAYAIAYPVAFKKMFKYLDPTFKYFDKSCIKELLNLSVLFFLIQLAGLITLSFSNVLVSNQFGPAEVTPFSIAQRYFGITLMLFNIIISPMWSATTDAYVIKDFNWIRKTNTTLVKLLLADLALLVVMVLISPLVYKIWIQDQVEIPLGISILMALYHFILIWSLSYSYFLNGMGKLKIQSINTIAAAVLFCPICIYLGHQVGVIGVVIGMCLINLPGAFLNTIQFKLVTSQKATGLWNS